MMFTRSSSHCLSRLSFLSLVLVFGFNVISECSAQQQPHQGGYAGSGQPENYLGSSSQQNQGPSNSGLQFTTGNQGGYQYPSSNGGNQGGSQVPNGGYQSVHGGNQGGSQVPNGGYQSVHGGNQGGFQVPNGGYQSSQSVHSGGLQSAQVGVQGSQGEYQSSKTQYPTSPKPFQPAQPVNQGYKTQASFGSYQATQTGPTTSRPGFHTIQSGGYENPNSGGYGGYSSGDYKYTTTTPKPTKPPRLPPLGEVSKQVEDDYDFVDPSPKPVSPQRGFVATTVSPLVGSMDQVWDIRDAIPGQPGEDYPVLSKIPKTSFTCLGKIAGYYADPETRCQVFHRCEACSPQPTVLQQLSFLCPNGTQFNQQILTCDWWANVECPSSEQYFEINQSIRAQNPDGSYAQLPAFRRPPSVPKVAPTIIPLESRQPLPPGFVTVHSHDGGHYEGNGKLNNNKKPPTQPRFPIPSGSGLSTMRPPVSGSTAPSPTSPPAPFTTKPGPKRFQSEDFSDYFDENNEIGGGFSARPKLSGQQGSRKHQGFIVNQPATSPGRLPEQQSSSFPPFPSRPPVNPPQHNFQVESGNFNSNQVANSQLPSGVIPPGGYLPPRDESIRENHQSRQPQPVPPQYLPPAREYGPPPVNQNNYGNQDSQAQSQNMRGHQENLVGNYPGNQAGGEYGRKRSSQISHDNQELCYNSQQTRFQRSSQETHPPVEQTAETMEKPPVGLESNTSRATMKDELLTYDMVSSAPSTRDSYEPVPDTYHRKPSRGYGNDEVTPLSSGEIEHTELSADYIDNVGKYPDAPLPSSWS